MDPVFFLVLVIAIVLVFEFTNGFHDAANAIATVVGTKVLTPRQAVVLGAATNFLGAFSGLAVAKTIGGGLVDSHFITTHTIFCAMIAGIAWNLFTWYFGIPSSSSHCLIGGLLGAAIASAHNNWAVIQWSVTKVDKATGAAVRDGLYPKVIQPMLASPVLGFLGGMMVMTILFAIIRGMRPLWVDRIFGKLQIFSAAYMGFSHGGVDGQKSMGIIALACYVATKDGSLDHVPDALSFLRTPEVTVNRWIVYVCAAVMAAGTYVGGWRIISTLGHKLVRLRPVHGFAAETAAATLLEVAKYLGMPVSTTHVITTSIMGVGCARRSTSVNWNMVERIVWAWILTIPATAGLGYLMVLAGRALGWMP